MRDSIIAIAVAAGTLVAVNGHRLYLHCTGDGSPAVILDAGRGNGSATWEQVQPAIAGLTAACSYDRFGIGRSDRDPSAPPRTSGQMVEDLAALLEAAQVPPPYVLVGHSLGGANVRLYASRWPARVAGMVLVDSSHEDQLARFAAIGQAQTPPSNGAGEAVDLERSFAEVGRQRWQADIPLVVLTRGKTIASATTDAAQQQRSLELWHDLQRDLAGRSPSGRLVVAERSGHYIQTDQPDLVIAAIRDVVAAVRTARRR